MSSCLCGYSSKPSLLLPYANTVIRQTETNANGNLSSEDSDSKLNSCKKTFLTIHDFNSARNIGLKQQFIKNESDSLIPILNTLGRSFAGDSMNEPEPSIQWCMEVLNKPGTIKEKSKTKWGDLAELTKVEHTDGDDANDTNANTTAKQFRIVKNNENRQNFYDTMMLYVLYTIGFYPKGGLVVICRNNEYEPATEPPAGVLILRYYPKGFKSENGCCEENCWPLHASFFAKPVKRRVITESSKNPICDSKIADPVMKRINMLGSAMKQQKKEATQQNPYEPALYISVVSVHPDSLGKGVCSRLMRFTTKLADEIGCISFLECGEGRREKVYQRYGFKSVCRNTVTDADGSSSYTGVGMLRGKNGM